MTRDAIERHLAELAPPKVRRWDLGGRWGELSARPERSARPVILRRPPKAALEGRRPRPCRLLARVEPHLPIIHAISGSPEIATTDAQVGYSRPEWLAEFILGPAKGRTRGLAPQDDGASLRPRSGGRVARAIRLGARAPLPPRAKRVAGRGWGWGAPLAQSKLCRPDRSTVCRMQAEHNGGDMVRPSHPCRRRCARIACLDRNPSQNAAMPRPFLTGSLIRGLLG